MKSTRFSAPFHRLGSTRSAGITDLRHGCVTEDDWHGFDRFGESQDTRTPLPLPGDVDCFALGVTRGTRTGDVRDRLIGDGLVSLDSALGIHRDEERTLAFPESRQWIEYGVSHMGLLSSPEVYGRLREWLQS